MGGNWKGRRTGGKDLGERSVLSLEWKREGVMDVFMISRQAKFLGKLIPEKGDAE